MTIALPILSDTPLLDLFLWGRLGWDEWPRGFDPPPTSERIRSMQFGFTGVSTGPAGREVQLLNGKVK